MPALVKEPSLHPSRAASRMTSRGQTREPSPEPDDQSLQESAWQEYEEPEDPETPPQIEKRKAPDIQVIYPTPSHPRKEEDWEDDPIGPTDEETKEIVKLWVNLSTLHKRWDPKVQPVEKSEKELVKLAGIINELVRDNPMPSMAGAYPKTLRKPSRLSAAYPPTRSAPKKTAGFLSRTASALGLPRVSSILFGSSNPPLPQPAPTPSVLANPLPTQHPANFPSSSGTTGANPYKFHDWPDITLNSKNQNTSSQRPQQQQTQNEPPSGDLPKRVSLPPDGNPPSDSSSSDSGASLPDNPRHSRGQLRRSWTADTTHTSASSILGSSSLKLPKLPTNDGRGKYKTAVGFDE